MSNRAEEYRIEASQLLHSIRRHHLAMFEVVLRTPRKFDELPLDAMPTRQRVQNLQRLINDIDTDTIALDNCYAVLTQSNTSLLARSQPLLRVSLCCAKKDPALPFAKRGGRG